MKTKLLALFAILLLSIIGVSATADITYTAENVQGFSALAYNCANQECSEVADFSGFLPSSTSNGQLTVEFPTEQSQYGYAVYFTSQGYFPKVVHATWYGDGAATRTFQFNRGDVCSAKIDEFSALNDVVQESPLTIVTKASLDATTDGAFSMTNHPVKYVPPSLSEYYTSDVKVTMTVQDSQGRVVREQSSVVKVLAGSDAPVEFNWIPQESGYHSLRLTTEVVDDQCASSQTQMTVKEIQVLPKAPRNMCYSILNNLGVEVNGQNVEATLASSTSYHANDYLFNNPNYQLTPISTELLWRVGTLDAQEPFFAELQTVEPNTVATKSWSNLQPGNYVLEVSADPQSTLCNGLPSQGESTAVTFTVTAPQTHTLSFQITDPSGTGVSEATLTLGGTPKTTDSNGRVSFADLQSGTYDYEVSKAGFKTLTGQVTIDDADENVAFTMDFETPVENPQPPQDIKYELTFTVLDKETKQPLDSASVNFWINNGDDTYVNVYGQTGSNGKITFTGLPNGLHYYSIWYPNYETRFETVKVAGGSLSLTVELERATGTSITPLTPEKKERTLSISSVRIPSAFEVKPGEQVLIVVNEANTGEEKLENVRATAVIQELGLRATSKVEDLGKKDSSAQKLVLDLPKDMTEGIYYLRISLDSDHVHRVIYREIEVV
ncbi:carboxypeptidase regulatory-like domain-containing protein [Candidatus Woesearchaeota archaeon]|nr:carboxypeptidase regulatory-like domain-containing protein [Candidatus Woesearchaeota archaeon]